MKLMWWYLKIHSSRMNWIINLNILPYDYPSQREREREQKEQFSVIVRFRILPWSTADNFELWPGKRFLQAERTLLLLTANDLELWPDKRFLLAFSISKCVLLAFLTIFLALNFYTFTDMKKEKWNIIKVSTSSIKCIEKAKRRTLIYKRKNDRRN